MKTLAFVLSLSLSLAGCIVVKDFADDSSNIGFCVDNDCTCPADQDCAMDCDDGSDCNVVCGGSAACETDCSATASCDVACSGSEICDVD